MGVWVKQMGAGGVWGALGAVENMQWVWVWVWVWVVEGFRQLGMAQRHYNQSREVQSE